MRQQMSDTLQLVVVIINTQLTRSAQSGRGQSGQYEQGAYTTDFMSVVLKFQPTRTPKNFHARVLCVRV